MIRTILDRGIESIALMVFLIYIQIADMTARTDWLLPYFLSSSLGVTASIYIFRKGILLNRLFMGITLYFCSGLLGLLTSWDWINSLYGELGAVAMLGWILITGVVTTLISRHGFLGVNTQGYFSIPQSSSLLLLACAIATLTAASFMNNKLLGEWIPFIFLFSMRSLLLQLNIKLAKNVITAG